MLSRAVPSSRPGMNPQTAGSLACRDFAWGLPWTSGQGTNMHWNCNVSHIHAPCCIYSPVCSPMPVSQKRSVCPINSRVSFMSAETNLCLIHKWLLLRYSHSTLKFGVQRLNPGTLFIPNLAQVVFRGLRNIKIKGLWLQMLFGPRVT